MRDGEIVGLTLAEMCLALLFMLLGALSFSHQQQENTRRELEEAKESNTQATSLVKDTVAKNGTLTIDNNRLKKELADRQVQGSDPGMPLSCEKKGLTKGSIFHAVIVGPDSFVIEDETVTAKEIEERFGRELGQAKEKGCIHAADTTVDPNLNAKTYYQALVRLERNFYVQKLGVR